MTKKDYKLVARCIKSTLKSYPEAINPLTMLTIYFASSVEVKNPKFNRSKFLQACGIR